jgi:hypothetical protein
MRADTPGEAADFTALANQRPALLILNTADAGLQGCVGDASVCVAGVAWLLSGFVLGLE